MSNDNSRNAPPSADMSRQRRSSVSNPLTNLFQRNGSTATATTAFPINDQRRRLSISTMGLSGTSPTGVNAPFNLRRASVSTNSDTFDENAIDDEDPSSARTAPTTPFTRRMSFGAQAMRNLRVPPGTSPGGSNGRPSPPLRRTSGRGPPTPPASASSSTGLSRNKTFSQASNATSQRAASDLISARSDQQGFNWSEQLRSRAESIAAGSRPSVSYAASPPRGTSVGSAAPVPTPRHDRAKSVSDMPAPPAQAPKPRPQKPDAFQERILKGDFYMD
ncbi:hypothetical protein CONLIGDRAFT_4546 [Coniochaeta ligniaria NRRL 30616]|uniref:Uncharacterized protein n=1 Tax=Coniochaeta ligniaria NRRL 30616 TaxID=1408157 RepID=A0A1J7J3R3_9PEZI|nr:hypothetical protein CONLIGDRAFT_4546 [Coniochaeta ligniaria NRRL 30616]